MGRMQREKGKRFERDIANEFRKRWPSAVVRRSSQAERADNPDVFIEGGPPLLAKLWLELQDARVPTPLAKLAQAHKDADYWQSRRTTDPRHPVVVWHRLGSRSSMATMRLSVLDAIRPGMDSTYGWVVVTMSLDEFMEIIEHAHPNRCTCTHEVGSGGPVCSCWFGQAKQREAA